MIPDLSNLENALKSLGDNELTNYYTTKINQLMNHYETTQDSDHAIFDLVKEAMASDIKEIINEEIKKIYVILGLGLGTTLLTLGTPLSLILGPLTLITYTKLRKYNEAINEL